jgi:hypothetical protein
MPAPVGMPGVVPDALAPRKYRLPASLGPKSSEMPTAPPKSPGRRPAPAFGAPGVSSPTVSSKMPIA